MLVFLTILTSMLIVTGQIMWKLGVTGKEINSISAILPLSVNPYIILGVLVYGCATGLWIYILSKSELSTVYPIQSVGFIFSLFAGAIIFKEEISISKIIGIIFICIGVIVITRK